MSERMSELKITETELRQNGVAAAPDVLSGTAAQNKEIFDRLTRNVVGEKFNGLIDLLDSGEGAAELPIAPIAGMDAENVQEALEELRDIREKVFVAKYGETSYDDVNAAYEAGKCLVCLRSGSPEVAQFRTLNLDGGFEFRAFGGKVSSSWYRLHVYTLTRDGWSMESGDRFPILNDDGKIKPAMLGTKELFEVKSGVTTIAEAEEAIGRGAAIVCTSNTALPNYAKMLTRRISSGTECSHTYAGVYLREDNSGDVCIDISELIAGRTLSNEWKRTVIYVAEKMHASEGTAHGLGSGTKYGHLKLADTEDAQLDVSGGVAATPKALTGKLSISGGTLTGPLVLAADPVEDMEAATKQYVLQHSGTGGIFEVVYGETSYTDAKAAYDAGNMLVAKEEGSGDAIAPMIAFAEPDFGEFTFAKISESTQNFQITMWTLHEVNGWSKKEPKRIANKVNLANASATTVARIIAGIECGDLLWGAYRDDVYYMSMRDEGAEPPFEFTAVTADGLKRRILDRDANMQWGWTSEEVPFRDLFTAVYGATTYAEMDAAYRAGLICKCRVSGKTIDLLSAENGVYRFMGLTRTGSKFYVTSASLDETFGWDAEQERLDKEKLQGSGTLSDTEDDYEETNGYVMTSVSAPGVLTTHTPTVFPLLRSTATKAENDAVQTAWNKVAFVEVSRDGWLDFYLEAVPAVETPFGWEVTR